MTVMLSAVVVCSKTPRNGTGAGKSLSRVRKQLTAQVAKLQSSRTEREDRRRKQLWGIAKALDEIAREEVHRGDSSETEVKVAFSDDLSADLAELSIDIWSSVSSSDEDSH